MHPTERGRAAPVRVQPIKYAEGLKSLVGRSTVIDRIPSRPSYIRTLSDHGSRHRKGVLTPQTFVGKLIGSPYRSGMTATVRSNNSKSHPDQCGAVRCGVIRYGPVCPFTSGRLSGPLVPLSCPFRSLETTPKTPFLVDSGPFSRTPTHRT